MNETDLLKLGLTMNEAKVYLALIYIGSTKTGNIVKRTGMHRVLVYDALERLIKKGLVVYVIKENRKYFESTNPENLLQYIKEKEAKLKQEEKLAKQIIPLLKGKYDLQKIKLEAHIYKGKKGLKALLEDILKTKKEYILFGAEGRFKQILPYYYIHFQKKKKKLKILTKAILSIEAKNKPALKEFAGKIKFIPKKFISPSTTVIYPKKVVIIIWDPIPFGVLINSKEVYESYKNYFKALWKTAKK